jgi:hypothetical protein
MGILAICITSISQGIQHEAVAINIEVPVRVYDGDTFIDNLTLKDFEIYEDGVLQKVEAVYLVKKTDIEREESDIQTKEAQKRFIPEVSKRFFILVFETIDYLPQLGEVIDYFFSKVYSKDDSLTVVSPLKTYELKKEIFKLKPLDDIKEELKEKLKQDTIDGNWEYKNIIREIVRGDATPDDFLRLKEMRYIEGSKLLNFADYLKNIEGPKHVFLFYQREVLPRNYNPLQYQSYVMTLDEFEFDITFDADKVKQVFSDASITAHFLYLTNTQQFAISPERMESGSIMLQDRSMNIFSAFSEVAQATGGVTESSMNPAFIFKKAITASENYYLLYYTPKDYKSDGEFRDIKVKVKGKNYKVLHRAGYLAD